MSKAIGKILMACTLFLLLPSPIFGQTSPDKCSSGDYTDLVDMGEINALVLQCRFATDRDQITIFPKGRLLSSETPWQENISNQNAIWLFDAGANDEVNLIIDFKESENNSLTAELFDDQDQDGVVSYEVAEGELTITESQFPTMRVIAQGNKWLKNGQLNYDLDIDVDGPLFAMASYGRFLDRLSTDGEIDFRIRVRDTNQDGFPDYDFRYETSPVLPEHWGLARVHFMVNEGGLSQTIQDSILWPLLGTAYGEPRFTTAGSLWLLPYKDAFGRRYGLVQDYSFLAPAIQVRWEESKILFLAEIVPSRATDKGWFVYSLSTYDPTENYMGNHENPFMFYDLHGNKDGIPELLIRAESYYSHDPHFHNGRLQEPNTMIRYSWKQHQNENWEYSINLVGPYATTESPIPLDEELTLMSVPYDEYPDWVMEKEWEAITFVQAVNGFAGIEGIYTWSAFNRMRDRYFIGRQDRKPGGYSRIQEGFRGEYVIRPNVKPILYFSPIDSRLHLLEAEAGVWNINGSQQIRYRNLGGNYINHWQLILEEEVNQTLYFVEDYLIYTDEDKIELRRTDLSPELFTTYPPRNHSEWLALDKKLETYQHDLEPTNFEAMFKQIKGRVHTYEGASLSDLRLLADGFRFVLQLEADFESKGAELLPLSRLKEGQYLVRYANHSFDIQELTPPEFSLSLKLSSEEQDIRRTAQPLLIKATNEGLQDAKDVKLIVEGHYQGNVFRIARQTLELLSGEPAYISLDWLPRTTGNWKLLARLEHSNQIVESAPQLFTVRQGYDNQLLLSMLWKRWQPIIFVLVALPLLVGFIISRAIVSSEREEQST